MNFNKVFIMSKNFIKSQCNFIEQNSIMYSLQL